MRDAFVRDGRCSTSIAMRRSRSSPRGWFSTDLRLARIDGRLTLRGVTRNVSLDVARFDCGAPGAEAPHDCKADATAILRRSDFGMDAYAPLIDDDIMLAFEVVGRR